MDTNATFILLFEDDIKQTQKTVEKIKKFISVLDKDERYAFRQWLYMSDVFPFDTAILDSWFNNEFADN